MAIDSLHRPSAATDALQFWNLDDDDSLICIDVHPETHDVKTFTFASASGKHFAFEAGQYFLFEPELEGQTESRCYSISSSPTRTGVFAMTVKRVPGGRVSNWLHDTMAPGAKIKARGPLGHFRRPAGDDRKLLLLSGGSGITPVMSMLRALSDRGGKTDVVFMHAARTPADLVFHDELKLISRRLKGVRLHLLPETTGDDPSWCGLTGRISADYMRLAVPDVSERRVMCCGPAPFMVAARAIVSGLGVISENYHEESFDAAPMEDAETVAPDGHQAQFFQVAFSKQARMIDVSADQTVLSCAKKAGIRIPSSCANGVCGTCKSRLLSGAVDMKHSGGIRQREIDAGLFLPCCSKPLSDLVVER
ncbi:2Fe-2S iron-sulfur cluster binding domain-containing protein [Rhizobiales bacterium RZME27]|uniref:2Fe-2S iron-sulfur cluster binding domain-containing protein n=1 Tax=Endobacterium cereale TaxID=2663029 RepID=A0A6A8A6C9_9HYPH|nr:hybrid-cluster NAD(P)-dependent oxidoreductase [Endobacterium cereale]MEB2846325.1 hybrid-cluster NAD(P)-dependent oxidoreductase [Endobacterium cereale]MQY46379.1 2Fe-2S iron-sulfur cluster binding domain-containing protein [Endobacterium cereale]